MQSQKMQSQGYFEFRLCPHNTRRRPAQQVNGNIFQRDWECFEGKILTFSGKPTLTEKISFFNTFFGRPASTSICWGERGEVFVSFLCLRNKLEAGRILIWSIISFFPAFFPIWLVMVNQQCHAKVLDAVSPSWRSFLCSLCFAMAILGWKLMGQVLDTVYQNKQLVDFHHIGPDQMWQWIMIMMWQSGVKMEQKALVADLKRSFELVPTLLSIL